MLVFRMEDAVGVGMYCTSGRGAAIIFKSGTANSVWPMPEEDSELVEDIKVKKLLNYPRNRELAAITKPPASLFEKRRTEYLANILDDEESRRLSNKDEYLPINDWYKTVREFELKYEDELYSSMNYSFGFKSYEQLRRWIYNDEWLTGLKESSIDLAVYEVPENWVMLGRTQCTFRKDKAKLVGIFDPTTSEEELKKLLENR